MSKTGGITPLDFEIDYQSVVIKTVQYWPKDRHMDQRSRRDSSEINLNKHDQFIFHECAKDTQWGRDINSLQQMMSEKLDIHMLKNESGSPSYTTHQLNSKQTRLKHKI